MAMIKHWFWLWFDIFLSGMVFALFPFAFVIGKPLLGYLGAIGVMWMTFIDMNELENLKPSLKEREMRLTKLKKH